MKEEAVGDLDKKQTRKLTELIKEQQWTDVKH